MSMTACDASQCGVNNGDDARPHFSATRSPTYEVIQQQIRQFYRVNRKPSDGGGYRIESAPQRALRSTAAYRPDPRIIA
jgi:hypothetical protein